MKCYRMKCCSVRAVEKLKIKDVTNGIRADLSPNMIWFEDKPGESWWACNTPIESHQNEKDSKFVQVLDCTTENDLKEFIDTTYTNKMHLFFSISSLKNFIVKRT